MTEEKETCSYYYDGHATNKNNFSVKLICDQLDDIGVEYTLSFSEHLCSMSPSAVFIRFKEEQDSSWIEDNVYTYYKSPNDYDYTVDITSGDLIKCDAWLLENFGFIEDKWTAGFSADTFNTYYFKNDTDAMAFKLTFA